MGMLSFMLTVFYWRIYQDYEDNIHILISYTFIFPIKYFPDSTAGESIIMLHNKQKAISDMLIIVVIILMLGSSVSAIPLQSAIDHHKAFAKKQDSTISSKNTGNGGGRDNSGRSSSSCDCTAFNWSSRCFCDSSASW
jgi:hypothetical protein